MAKQLCCFAAPQSGAAKSFLAFRHHIIIIAAQGETNSRPRTNSPCGTSGSKCDFAGRAQGPPLRRETKSGRLVRNEAGVGGGDSSSVMGRAGDGGCHRSELRGGLRRAAERVGPYEGRRGKQVVSREERIPPPSVSPSIARRYGAPPFRQGGLLDVRRGRDPSSASPPQDDSAADR